MKCPVDNTTLLISDHKGIEIDYCPSCSGVWLDRGELDKIIERSGMSSQDRDRHQQTRTGHTAQNEQPRKPMKKSSLLGDLLDF